jgi:hypothetical protein
MSKKLSTLIENIQVPILSNVIFNNENYNYCLAEIHGRGKQSKIINLHLWNYGCADKKILINWKGKDKQPLSRQDIRRLKNASKVYANQTS